MKKYAHLQQKARELRRRGGSLTQICGQLALGKSTVHGWIRDIPIPPTPFQSEQRRRAGQANRRKHARQREEWYAEAYQQAPETLRDARLRDFVVLYAAEGYKRNRNQVCICNSNPAIMRLAHRCIRHLSKNQHLEYQLQCHVDNDERTVRQYWADVLEVPAGRIKVIRKSNAGGLKGRQWRSEHGVLTVRVGNTELRCRIQAWMDYLQQDWARS